MRVDSLVDRNHHRSLDLFKTPHARSAHRARRFADEVEEAIGGLHLEVNANGPNERDILEGF
uniref:Uncharacterized protein n=1 Tax=mine drainage metagenome TaxID=410659 RepID=E6PE63_9ZZZZ